MSEQPTLFELHREPLAKARTTDPESSHAAAEQMNKSGAAEHQRQRVTDLVFQYPGKTSRQLAELCEDLERHQIARRLPEAEEAEMIYRKKDGKKELTWWPK